MKDKIDLEISRTAEQITVALAQSIRERINSVLLEDALALGEEVLGVGGNRVALARSLFAYVTSPTEKIVVDGLTVPRMADGSDDLTTVAEISHVLDELEVPTVHKDLQMTVAGRVHHLGDLLQEERERAEELEGEAENVSADFERDLWRSTRRILDRLGFDWKQVGSEGVTAHDAEDFIMDAITRLQRAARPKQEPLPADVTGPLPVSAHA